MGLNSKSNTGEGAQAVAMPTNKSVAGRPSILNISSFLCRIELASPPAVFNMVRQDLCRGKTIIVFTIRKMKVHNICFLWMFKVVFNSRQHAFFCMRCYVFLFQLIVGQALCLLCWNRMD